MPKVSVIIPTLNRPAEVHKAIYSALNQTYQDLEVIVVIDGIDHATEKTLRAINDSRVRVLVNQENVGLAESRNVGVKAAHSDWIAFLDDDDEWLIEKIEKQMEVAERLEGDHVVVVTRFLEKTATMKRVWPERLPENTSNFSDYLFCNRGMLLPSTYLVSRALMCAVPFTKGLRHIEDLDWLLRATSDPRTRIGSVPDALLIYNNYSVPGRESRNFHWHVFYTWSINNRSLFSPLAFSYFITKGVVPRAKEAGASWRELIHLFSASIFLGSFDPRNIFFFVASSLFTREFKRHARELISPAARKAKRAAHLH